MRALANPLAGQGVLATSLALACAALLGLSGCNAWRTGDNGLGTDHIRVPHDKHKAAQVDCIACHETIWDQTELNQSSGEGPLPLEAKCLECHAEQKEKGNCGFCHSNVKQAIHWPKKETELVMNHKTHIERVKEDCTQCHKQLPEPYREPSQQPPMAACLNCHEHQEKFDAGKCNDCHTDLSHYPLKPITAYSHSGNYVQRHSRDARNSADQCAMCHEQTFCADCHANTVGRRVELMNAEKVGSDFIHRNDYLSRHALEAKLQPAQCMRCHGQTFCNSCHTDNNLTKAGANPRDPHPVGWSLPNSAQFHGPAARRDITSCAACHDQGPRSNCIDCHKVGAIGGNPHPPGWTDKHPRADINRNGMCLYCHQ